jgi:hypothetical protein
LPDFLLCRAENLFAIFIALLVSGIPTAKAP